MVVVKKFGKVLALTMLISAVGAGQALAMDGTAIYVNDQYLRLDTMPYVSEGTTFVPLRTVSSALGADVSWADGQAHISLGGQDIVLRPNDKTAVVNGAAVELSAAPVVQDGRILVPLRFVSERLGAGVDYADHIIDITPAAGSVLPDIPSVYANGASQYADDSAEYIYLSAWDGVERINKATLEREVVAIPTDTGELDIRGFSVVGDKLYFSGDYGQSDRRSVLTVFDTLTGTSEYFDDGVFRCQVYRDWVYYLDTQLYNGTLYRVALVDGKASGEPQQVAKDVSEFWFVGDSLYWSSWGIKAFRMDLDGQNPERQTKVTGADWYDAGYYYTTGNGATHSTIYRYKAGASEPEVVYSWGRSSVKDLQVFGDKVYFSSWMSADDGRGHWAQYSGPLYCVDLDGENLRQLTDGKVLDYFVFGDILLYENQNSEWCVKRLDD